MKSKKVLFRIIGTKPYEANKYSTVYCHKVGDKYRVKQVVCGRSIYMTDRQCLALIRHIQG